MKALNLWSLRTTTLKAIGVDPQSVKVGEHLWARECVGDMIAEWKVVPASAVIGAPEELQALRQQRWARRYSARIGMTLADRLQAKREKEDWEAEQAWEAEKAREEWEEWQAEQAEEAAAREAAEDKRLNDLDRLGERLAR